MLTNFVGSFIVNLNKLNNLFIKFTWEFHSAILDIIMTDETKETIRSLLILKMSNILGVAEDTLERMSKTSSFPDPLDRVTSESISSIELRKRDRERKLLQKIRDALSRLENGIYGICELCESEISIERLIVRPETTLCIRCKEEQEYLENRFG